MPSLSDLSCSDRAEGWYHVGAPPSGRREDTHAAVLEANPPHTTRYLKCASARSLITHKR
jgi:hypothetical protein